MEKAKHRVQFEAEVSGDGTVSFSRSVHDLRLPSGSKVTVSIFGGVISNHLQKLHVTGEEVEMIGSVQLEDREHVMRFLSSQGTLRGSSFEKKVRTLWR